MYFFNNNVFFILLFSFVFHSISLKAQVENYTNDVLGLYKTIKDESRFTDVFNAEQAVALPIGIRKEIGGREYALLIDSMSIGTDRTNVSAYAVFTIPWSDEKIIFGARDIELYPEGFTGAFKLKLIQPIVIPFGKNKISILPARSYAEFDCNGFKHIQLDMSFEFSDDILVPENPDGSIRSGEKVVVPFLTGPLSDLEQLFFELDLPDFQIKGLKGFGFVADKFILDLSNEKNPTISDPGFYENFSSDPSDFNLWQGFYAQKIALKLPQSFNSASTQRTEIGVENLYIDQVGVSMEAFVKNLIALENGTLGTWNYALDKFSLKITGNSVTEGKLIGRLQLPVMKEKETFEITGLIAKNDYYSFTVKTKSDLSFQMWSAKLDLYPDSYVSIVVDKDRFLPKAVLNGKISIGASMDKGGDSKLSLSGLRFRGMQIQTIVPYFDVQYLSLDNDGEGNTNMSNFPITLKKIAFVRENEKCGLAITIALNLSKTSDKGFAAEAGLSILGKISNNNQWVFDNVYLDKIKIDVQADAFSLLGELILYRSDPIYGEGFKGMIRATIQPGISIGVTAQFGNVRGFRYWYVDGLLILPTGIPIATGFGIYGFKGGVYYRMKQDLSKIMSADPSKPMESSDGSNVSGVSLSGISYIPDENMGLGIRAGVTIATMPTSDPFNADVTFEISFNINGGIKSIGFFGDAYMLTSIVKRSPDAPIRASFGMLYDFPNKTFHASFEVYLNVAGIIKGTGPGNKAGWLAMHFAPDKWYIYVGVPDQRVSIELFDAIQVNAYFMCGSILPDMPLPPKEVVDIFGADKCAFMRDESALGNGGGFAFGVGVSFGTGDLKFLIFYASFNMGLGFDIMLKNYGEGIVCRDQEETMGMNGWYASGQLYAYVQGSVGLFCNLFGSELKVEILSLSVAVLLQGKLPNPTWIRGMLGGKYSVLGGLISGTCSFELTIGKECEVVSGSVVQSVKVIESISPALNTDKVSVDSDPSIRFSVPVLQVFEREELNGVMKKFRIRLESPVFVSNNGKIKFKMIWNSINTKCTLIPESFLPEKSKCKIFVKVIFENEVNGQWIPVTINGQVYTEEASTLFHTSDAPRRIPNSNIALMYPIEKQIYVYPDHAHEAYIVLKKKQNYLFLNNKLFLCINSVNSTERIYDTIPCKIENDGLKLVFDFSTFKLKTNFNVDLYVQHLKQPLYNYSFTTSEYKNIQAKVASFELSKMNFWPIMNGVHEITGTFKTNEYFSDQELSEQDGVHINIQVELEDDYFNSKVLKQLYYSDKLIFNAVQWRSQKDKFPRQGIRIKNGSKTGQYVLSYNQAYYYFKDYLDLKSFILNQALFRKPTSSDKYLIENPFPDISKGIYTISFTYTIPGKTEVVDKIYFKIQL